MALEQDAAAAGISVESLDDGSDAVEALAARVMEEEAKVKQIFGEKKPKNEFEEWCTRSLQNMQAQVDIPTFLGFLMDIESPYEVHDYIKSYVGEEKPQKKFAVDYLERRSRSCDLVDNYSDYAGAND
jgi:PERQ amino acid-rich with GYF domain-containing protein